MTNLDTIPRLDGCTEWQPSPNGRGFYRLYGERINPRVQFVDAHGSVLVVTLDL